MSKERTYPSPIANQTQECLLTLSRRAQRIVERLRLDQLYAVYPNGLIDAPPLQLFLHGKYAA